MTKNQAKLIRSLHDKKDRLELGLFLVEGEKSVVEVLNSNFKIEAFFVTNEFLNNHSDLTEKYREVCEIVTQEELEKVSTLESNNAALAVVKQNANILPTTSQNDLILCLDDVRDPGNLGTIIRIADWYGIKNIIASESTVDFYNPKVISATKGSFTRVNVTYTDLKSFLPNTKLPVLGAFMSGDNVHTFKFPSGGILLMGNESNGISTDIEKFVTQKITIPRLGSAESLNVGVATAVILDNWKRN